MARTRTVYACQGCGHTSHKWLGRCPECSSWDSFLEERVHVEKKKAHAVGLSGSASAPRPITTIDGSDESRVSTRIGELDRVLGGGVVPGSSVLIGGDPGIGKSTLLLQAVAGFAAAGMEVLYVSGEESLSQIRLRAERLGALSPNLIVYSETSLEAVMDTLAKSSPGLIVIDSVQTMSSVDVDSAPGSLSQIREAAHRLISYAKGSNVPVFLVGHVTKEGFLAGPKVLEHMVDTVLYFEGEKDHAFRVLRAAKNRFGSVMEIGIFEMREEGLVEVINPSEVFLAERPLGASGSAVVASMEGTRTILVEVQSLVCPTVFGIPRRTVVGVDLNKVNLLTAVLEKKASMVLASHDIFLKVTGGIRLDEPAVDLGVVAAISSNFLDKPIDPGTVVFGEVGLAGEVRAVVRPAQRVKEAEKLGFKRCLMPADSLKGGRISSGMELIGVSTVAEAIERLFSTPG